MPGALDWNQIKALPILNLIPPQVIDEVKKQGNKHVAELIATTALETVSPATPWAPGFIALKGDVLGIGGGAAKIACQLATGNSPHGVMVDIIRVSKVISLQFLLYLTRFCLFQLLILKRLPSVYVVDTKWHNFLLNKTKLFLH